MNDDDRLKHAFGTLRRHDEKHAPPFKVPATPPAERSRGKVIALFAAPATALAVAAAAMLFLVRGERSPAPTAATPPSVQVAAAPADLAPLDFLLDVPAGSVISNERVFDDSVLSEVKR
jgi:hypothetical protein